jgi:starch-binding outer membrane protein, SusD/RagB family
MKKYLVLISSILILASCNKNVFDKGDLTGVESTNVWNDESTANLYINKTYDLVMPVWPTGIHNTSDETNNTGSTAILYGTLTSNDVADIYAAAGSGVYSWVRRTNIALEGVESGSLSADVKYKLKAQNYFLRAYMYFNLVKLYGGVPLVLHVQDVVKEDLNVPRTSTSACIDSIVKDLDSCMLLPGKWDGSTGNWSTADRGRITRGAAAALKAKVLLFWASPQFNPSNDAARWERAYKASSEAYAMLTNDGYALYPTFANIFLDETTTNKEVIMLRTYDLLNKTNTIENVTRPISESAAGGGSNQPTLNLVKAFPMKNGLMPFNSDGTVNAASGYDPVYYWKNRDPRFDATVAYNGVVWALSGKAGRKQWIYTGVSEDAAKPSSTGFYNRKMPNPAVLAANAAIGNGTDWIEMRLAEVVLTLAECANATNRMTEAQNMVILIRKRAGITAGTNNMYGISTTITQAQMFDLIMNERRVEFAFEGKRYDDLRRTKLWTSLNGTVRYALKIAIKTPYTVAILEAKDANGVTLRDKLDLSGVDYTNYFTTSEISLDTQFPINFLTNYYFYGMPLSALQSNTAIQQTSGWPGGTFDPLK